MLEEAIASAITRGLTQPKPMPHDGRCFMPGNPSTALPPQCPMPHAPCPMPHAPCLLI
ncbi:hypothetical protein [Tolypothrix sp. VBCCA 56010]|uniref:hypothetical protein n=1 Tax=Tolypothrix sp. VBCCA 56010 TaxID=3137731 RepID=UPI003D7F086F